MAIAKAVAASAEEEKDTQLQLQISYFLQQNAKLYSRLKMGAHKKCTPCHRKGKNQI